MEKKKKKFAKTNRNDFTYVRNEYNIWLPHVILYSERSYLMRVQMAKKGVELQSDGIYLFRFENSFLAIFRCQST